MAEKVLQTRIQLKYDTYENWNTKNPVLKAGEMSVCTVPSGGSASGADQTTKPAVLFKVGDGTSNWKSLPWATALAGDVYSWAKTASKPSYDYSEIANTPTIPEYNDTNTTYRLLQDANDGHKFTLQSQEKGATAWTNVTTIVIPDNDHNDNDNQTVKGNGTAFGKNDAIDLVGDGIEVIPDTTNKKITFKAAAKPSTAGTADKVAHDLTLKAGSNTKTYNGSAAVTFEVSASDLGLSSAMHFLGISTTAVTDHGTEKPTIGGSAVTPAEGDVVLYNHEEFVWAKVGASGALAWERLGRDSSFALADHTHQIEANGSGDGVVDLNGTTGELGVTYTASHAKKGPAGGKTAGPGTDVTISGSGASGSIKIPRVVVDEYGHTTGLAEQTLAITMPTLPTIPTKLPNPEPLAFNSTKSYDGSAAMTLYIEDLNQASGNVLVFNCGSASVNI